MNITEFAIPDGTPNYWSDKAYEITEKCRIRDLIRNSTDQGAEFIRWWEENWYVYELNTHWGQKAYWAAEHHP